MLYFYRALGTGDEAKALRTAVQAYKLSDAANPPKTKFVKYEPKPGDKIALNTQPHDMQSWELVNAYVQREPMVDRDWFFYAWLKDRMPSPTRKQSDWILTTKLNPPLIRSDILDRPHLLARLERDVRDP